MSDLVERLRMIAENLTRVSLSPGFTGKIKVAEPSILLSHLKEAADALEAAQARIEAVRRETVAECAAVAIEAAKKPASAFTRKRMGLPWPVTAKPLALQAIRIAAAIRALTEAKEDHIPDARKMVEAKEDRT